MPYSRIEVLTIDAPIVVRKNENINKLEVVNLTPGANSYVDAGGVILTGESGRNRILFDAGEGRVFNQDFVIRDYCDSNACYLINALVIKTIYE